jgi:hypothetical protein
MHARLTWGGGQLKRNYNESITGTMRHFQHSKYLTKSVSPQVRDPLDVIEFCILIEQRGPVDLSRETRKETKHMQKSYTMRAEGNKQSPPNAARMPHRKLEHSVRRTDA